MLIYSKKWGILDEKDKRLRLVSKDVTFPLSKDDLKTIDLMVEYLTNSQKKGYQKNII